MSWWWLSYPLLGIFGGFVAGLFGVGGGMTLVPFMYMIFLGRGCRPGVIHLSLGTSMATILLTSISQHARPPCPRRRQLDHRPRHGAALVIGTFGGSQLAGQVPTRPLTLVFVVIVYYAAAQMILDARPKPTAACRKRPDYWPPGLIGIVSSLVAAGGGFPLGALMVATFPAYRRRYLGGPGFRSPSPARSATSSPAGRTRPCQPSPWVTSISRLSPASP